MKKLLLILFVAFVFLLPSCDLGFLLDGSDDVYESSEGDDSNTLLGFPSQPVDGRSVIVSHDAYTALYSLEDLVPVWVSWHLDAEDSGDLARDDIRFKVDPQITDKDYTVTHDDYKNSGFDRGHLCPNADRDSTEALQLETFYTTNVAMQNSNLNKGEWKYLEEDIRSVVNDLDYEAYIIAGTYGSGGYVDNDSDIIYEYDNPESNKERKITVPAYFWKVAVIIKDDNADLSRIDEDADMLAVWFPNAPVTDEKPWSDYIKSVDYIESQTGLDLFSEIPDDIENKLESIPFIYDESDIF